MSRNLAHASATVVLLLASAAVLTAQSAGGTMSETVRDSTGAVIPGVRVNVIHVETNRETAAATNDRGLYTVLALPVGMYRVDVAHQGFKRYVRSNIVLVVQQ